MTTLFSPQVSVEALQKRRGGFATQLGVTFTEVGTDFLRATLTVNEHHLRSGGIVNGGVFLSLVESVGSAASAAVVEPTGGHTLGIQVTANHLRTSRTGDILTVTARPKHIGQKTHIWDVSITNQDAKLISAGTITMLIVQRI